MARQQLPLAPPTPPGGDGGGFSSPFNYQLSRTAPACASARAASLPARSNTLRELLFPQVALTGTSAGQAPLPTRCPSHRPSLPRRPARLPQQPAISSRSLRGTRKGNVKHRLVSLRRGHPLPSVVAGTNSPSGHRGSEVGISRIRVPCDPWKRVDHLKLETHCQLKSGVRFKLGLWPHDLKQTPPLPGCLSDGGGVPRWRLGCRRLCSKL